MNRIYNALNVLLNLAYPIIILIFITIVYYANQIIGNVLADGTYFHWTVSALANLIILIGLYFVVLENIRPKGKINFLQIFSYIYIIITCSIMLAKQNSNNILFPLIIIFTLIYCYKIVFNFYNLLLKKHTDENNIGKTFDIYFVLLYTGLAAILLPTLYYIISHDKISSSLEKHNFEHLIFIFLITALYFFIFSLQMIYYLKNKSSSEKNSDQYEIIKKIININCKNKFFSTGKFFLVKQLYFYA